MKITIDNYFDCSKGQFKEVAPAIAKQLIKVLDLSIEHKEFTDFGICELQTVVKCNEKAFVTLYGKRFEFIHKSYSKRWDSLSAYFSDGESLIRISDHWSDGSKVNNCGKIRRCFWTIKKAKSSRSYAVTAQRKKVQVGITRFSEMV